MEREIKVTIRHRYSMNIIARKKFKKEQKPMIFLKVYLSNKKIKKNQLK